MSATREMHFFNPMDHRQIASEEVGRIHQSFDRLAEDPWFCMKGSRRLRAMSKFSWHDTQWKQLEDTSFFQSESINRYNGGVQRNFPPIDDSFVASSFLMDLAFDQAQLLGIAGGEWVINVHQIRVQTHCNPDAEGLSTPEGIHQDGHDFIGIVLWNRSNIVGGASRIYDESKSLLKELSLKQRGDTLLLNDRVCFHAVTPFYPQSPEFAATRDIFILDWNQRKP
mgnify:CR=1 FL=1